LHPSEFGDQHVGDVVLLTGLQRVVRQLRQEGADLRVHHLVLDVGVHREQLDDLLDDLALRDRCVVAGLGEPAGLLTDLLVVGLQQHNASVDISPALLLGWMSVGAITSPARSHTRWRPNAAIRALVVS
jgi:hypothetical protein